LRACTISTSSPAATSTSTKRCIGVVILFVDADAALYRYRYVDGGAHRGDAVGNQRRLAHQARAEAPGLHAIGRAADIEVDLVVAELGADASRSGQLRRLVATELQRDRMLVRAEAEQALAIAMQHRAGRDHLAVQARVRRQQAMEIAAMTVGPVHHGCGK